MDTSLNTETIIKFIRLLPEQAVKDAIDSLQKQAEEAEDIASKSLDEAKRLRKEVDALKLALESKYSTKRGVLASLIETEKRSRQTYSGGSFKDRLQSIFEDGIVKTSRQILDLHSSLFGVMKEKTFSSQISTNSGDGKPFKQIELDLPNGKNNYYGLTEWFDETGLKEKYKLALEATLASQT